eukprot:snap_masked-scaffold_4-processed-gene-14.39-mRNA-1 protein AED:1.00 eAED:1.00 QI:0/0/0/0/1/1/2/0/72
MFNERASKDSKSNCRYYEQDFMQDSTNQTQKRAVILCVQRGFRRLIFFWMLISCMRYGSGKKALIQLVGWLV